LKFTSTIVSNAHKRAALEGRKLTTSDLIERLAALRQQG